jgi:outer membrane protein assembly factor BamB
MTLVSRLLVLSTILAAVPFEAFSADWPMWRHDAARTAATPDALPRDLHEIWVNQLPPQQTAWPASQDKLQFDASYQPIVVGRQLIVGSTVNDSVAAYDTQTGAELWRFYTEAPVRFAPAAWRNRVVAASDDGWLYCLNLASGELLWKVRGGPQQRPIIGNDRLISTWPARGGPVVADETVYFAAGIWPSMGVFIHAVDAATGNIKWTNSEVSSRYITHPHGADAFGSISPQGALVVSGDDLLVPGGRTLPAVFDRRTGAFKNFQFGGKGGAGHAVLSAGPFYFVDDEMYLTVDGALLALLPATIFDGRRIIGANRDSLVVTPYSEQVEETAAVGRRGEPITKKSFRADSVRHSLRYAGSPMLMAGELVYVAAKDRIAAYPITPPERSGQPLEPVWSVPFNDTAASMLAANNKLFVVTTSGRIHCFGPETVAPATPPVATAVDSPASDVVREFVADLSHTAPFAGGYAVVAGAEEALVRELIAQTKYRLVVIDSDAGRVEQLRRTCDAAGWYGSRLSAHVTTLTDFHLPPYLADLIVVPHAPSDDEFGAACAALHPYGGVAFVRATEAEHDHLHQILNGVDRPAGAEFSRHNDWTVIRRNGPLPGSGSWTHQYADASNSVVSDEGRVRAPLGILWFGGPANDKVLPRHGHGPTPQVAGGRLVIEGANMLRCTDVYTGRLIWERELPGLGKFYDSTSHQPGAGEIGSNYVTLPDRVYVIHAGRLLALDAATGETVQTFSATGADETANWSWLAVEGDMLLATAAPVALQGVKPSREAVVPPGSTAVVPPHAKWRYVAGSDPPDEWINPDFDTNGWREGEAGFGYGDNDDRTVLSDMLGRYGRVSVRTEFDGAGLEGAAALTVMMNHDDGFIGWLNGHEVLRVNIGEGRGPTADELDSHEADGYEAFDIPDFHKYLVPGKNVLCLEGHNDGLTSSDFSLDPYVLARREEADVDAPQLADLLKPAAYAAESRRLVAFDRHTGEVRWQRDAAYSFRHNGICAGGGQVYCVDGMSDQKLDLLRRRGVSLTDQPRLLALDLITGDETWSAEEEVTGTFLNYSREHDVVLLGGSAFRDRAADESGQGLFAFRGADGSVLWQDAGVKYSGPCLLLGDRIITNGNGGFELGLLSGEASGWSYTRMYGCNTAVGCTNLLTFRSGAAGILDLTAQSGTGNLGGFRSSCTSNLIPADGVLNAPDYTRTCSCAYQLQTSLAFVHDPDVEYWTFNDPKTLPPQSYIGINLGAPGDRKDDNGLLWLEYPVRGGPSPAISVNIEPAAAKTFIHHSATLPDGQLNWIGASGVIGARRITWKSPAPLTAAATVRLVFADPDRLPAGQRVSSVKVQGRTVLENWDVAREASSPGAVVVRDIPAVEIGDQLTIELVPSSDAAGGETVLCGFGIMQP